MGIARQSLLREVAADPAARRGEGKQLLAAASVPSPVVKLIVPNNPEMMRAAEVIQAMAAEAGFDIRIEATEFATSLDRGARAISRPILSAGAVAPIPTATCTTLLPVRRRPH